MSTVSSTTSSSAVSKLSAKTGIGGLVSGMDTDSLVEGLTTASRTKITKQEQNLQKSEWKQTAYRDVTKSLKDFQSKYLDVLSSTNMRSEKLYNTVAASTTSASITATATSNAIAGSITIDSITQLATNATLKGTAGVSDPLSGKMTSAIAGTMDAADISNLLTNISGKSIKMTLDGTVKTITFDSTFIASAAGSTTNLQTAFQDKVNAAFGYKSGTTPMVNVSIVNDQLNFGTDSASQLTVNDLNSDKPVLASLGLKSGQTNKLNTNVTLGDLPLATSLDAVANMFSFSINSVDFSFNKTDTLATVMSRINSSAAGVTIGYSSISDRFTLAADDSGSAGAITITETQDKGLMAALGLKGITATSGVNAEFKVNGQTVTRTSNSVEVNGVKVELLQKTDSSSTIALKEDTTSLKDTITSFVEDYNTLIDKMNTLVKEKYDSDYQPLTDDQKSAMSDTEIKDWETKAKTGLLTGDSTIRSITNKMQALMYSSAVKGGISLYSMGITSAGYTENGKLVIDENKLDTALENQGSAIKELFTTETTGLGNQLNSIITGAVKTSGVKGDRGSLVELAGYENTLSDTENSITTSITKTNKMIKELKAELKDKETYYWAKFSAMETAIQSLNSQSSMITSFSSGS